MMGMNKNNNHLVDTRDYSCVHSSALMCYSGSSILILRLSPFNLVTQRLIIFIRVLFAVTINISIVNAIESQPTIYTV